MPIDHVKLWKRKKYIDLWSVPHILTGTILASFFYWLQFDFLLNILISTILIISWEFIEYFIILDVKEKLSNSISDILAGWLGFSIMYFFILKFSFDLIYPYFITIIIINIFLAIWGFLAYEERINKV